MDKIKISTARFEHKSGDKTYNLDVIDKLSEKAAYQGANVIAFHKCFITGYTSSPGIFRKNKCLVWQNLFQDGVYLF